MKKIMGSQRSIAEEELRKKRKAKMGTKTIKIKQDRNSMRPPGSFAKSASPTELRTDGRTHPLMKKSLDRADFSRIIKRIKGK